MTDTKPYTDEELETAAALRYSALPGDFAALVALDPGRGDRVRDATRRILDAVAPAIIRRAKAEGWDEGYEAGYQMARSWGHVDYWEGEPANPYAGEIEAAK